MNRRDFPKRYSKENLHKAFELIKKEGFSIRRAALKANVPYSTLQDKTSGKNQLGGKWGKQPLFTETEEGQLADHILKQSRCGYGVTKKHLKTIASELLHAKNVARSKVRRLVTNGWIRGFLRRWPQFRTRKPQQLNMNRAYSTSKSAVTAYFNELKNILDKYDLKDQPQRIFNVDETGFLGEDSPPKVIAPKNFKINSITSSRGAITTVLVTSNAIGNTIPPSLSSKESV